ncbi:uncharacterized protein LOC106011224 [Aplysia californica]|uniref:Uncharacterized protein LOC106011224 n=1 Tax=Aplysia californica TaxID=6500 RepID=A0ABM0ZVP2_APLCA|nr:uncharacterized protein LOC106011224 [Aplysia californica]
MRNWGLKNLKVDLEKHTATVRFPGLGGSKHDKFGLVTMETLQQMAVVIRLYILHQPYNEAGDEFLDWDKATADRMFFICSAQMTMSEALWDTYIIKWPLDARVSLGNVGKSSFSFVTEFFLTDVPDKPVFRETAQAVAVNLFTRKSLPLPDWFQEKYSGKGVLGRSFIIRPIDKPGNTYVQNVKVSRRDSLIPLSVFT